MDDRQREALAVAGRQAELVTRVEPANALGGADALGQAGVGQVAGQAEARVERRGARVERLSLRRFALARQHDGPVLVVEIVVGVAGAEVVVTERVAAGALLELAPE